MIIENYMLLLVNISQFRAKQFLFFVLSVEHEHVFTEFFHLVLLTSSLYHNNNWV